MKGICIDSGTHVIKLHLGCITNVDAVDLHGCIEQDEGQEHIDGEDKKDGEKRHIPAFIFDSAYHDFIEFFKVCDIRHEKLITDYDKEEVMHRTLKIEISAKKDHDKIIDYIADKFYFDHHGTANSFEICALDTSKAKGVQKVLEYLHIDKEHSYAFGDGLNDLEMIHYVGHGIAMGNAVDELKKIADEVIGHVDEQGLEEYLKTIEE